MTTIEVVARLIPEPIVRYARAAEVSRFIMTTTRDLLVISSPLFFQVVMISAQSLQPGYNPLRDTISSLVWSHFGWVQTANFFLLGGLLIALVRKLRACMADEIALKAGGILLYLVGLGFIMLAIFPTQSPGGVKTIQATVHGITVYFITFLFPAACFLLAPALRNGKRSGFIFCYTIVTGSLCLGLIALGIFLMLVEAHWFGMLERLLLINGFIWLEVLGVYCAGEGPQVR